MGEGTRVMRDAHICGLLSFLFRLENLHTTSPRQPSPQLQLPSLRRRHNHLRCTHRFHSGQLLLRVARFGASDAFSYNRSTWMTRVSCGQHMHSRRFLAPERAFQFMTVTLVFLARLPLHLGVPAQPLFDGFEVILKERA